MGFRRMTSVRAMITFAAACLLWMTASSAPQAGPDVPTLLKAVANRIATYYHRAQGVMFMEASTVQPIDRQWSLQGFARTVESEVRVELDGVVRTIRRVNGRVPRESDQTSRSGCTDPLPLSPDLLAFLLAPQRESYRFTSVRHGRERDRPALIVDFTSISRTGRPELIEDSRGHDDCFDWKGPLAVRGRVWVDAQTYDVLRMDRGLTGPVDVRVPILLQRRYHFDPYLVIDREDVSMRFKPVAFKNPDETLLLPDTIETVTILRSGLQSTRRTETFSEYRRFLTGARIKGR